MPTTNRRDFLKIAACLSTAVVAGNTKVLYADSQETPGEVRAWRTT